MGTRTLEFMGAADRGACPCCGHMSRVVWGFVSHDEAPEAAYFVSWTVDGVPAHGASFDLILGEWPADGGPSERVGVSLAFRWGPAGPEFMVVDADQTPLATHELVGRCLRRPEVVGTPLAAQAFAVVDAIWLEDHRIAEITAPR